ncbi:MAG: MFS transporter [Verrucomicrobiae bacterium]|nr:MFS transporter [Verrucomicrobiae bacterium]
MPSEPSPSPAASPPPTPKENLWGNLVCNAVLPGFLLTQLSKPERLGPVWGLIAALCVPLGYGIYDLVRRRTWNVFSVLGLVSTLLTGGLGLLKVSNLWFAVKEAAVPLVLGLAIPLTLRTRQPLVRTLIYNDQVLDTDRIGQRLVERQAVPEFDALLRQSSWVLATAFLFSAVLNFLLARWMVTAVPGSPEHVAQLGKLNWVSYPVIMVPSLIIMAVALFRLLKGLEALTGLKGDELFHASARHR